MGYNERNYQKENKMKINFVTDNPSLSLKHQIIKMVAAGAVAAVAAGLVRGGYDKAFTDTSDVLIELT